MKSPPWVFCDASSQAARAAISQLDVELTDSLAAADMIWTRDGAELHHNLIEHQLLNHLPAEDALLHLGQLARHLKRYSATLWDVDDVVCEGVRFPETYWIQSDTERSILVSKASKADVETDLWALEPTPRDREQVIGDLDLLERDPAAFITRYGEGVEGRDLTCQRVVPWTLSATDNRPAFRVYWMIANVDPLRVLLYDNGTIEADLRPRIGACLKAIVGATFESLIETPKTGALTFGLFSASFVLDEQNDLWFRGLRSEPGEGEPAAQDTSLLRVVRDAAQIALEVQKAIRSNHSLPRRHDWSGFELLMEDPPQRHSATRFTLMTEASRLETAFAAIDRAYLTTQVKAMLQAATIRNVPWLILSEDLIQLGHGRFQHRISGTRTTHTSQIGCELSRDKKLTSGLFDVLGVPVPAMEVVRNEAHAVSASLQLGFPVIVKPLGSSMERGVSARLDDPDAVRAAFYVAQEFDSAVVVERYVEGSDYRFLIVGSELVAVAERAPVQVVGDGYHTLAQLVARLNRHRYPGWLSSVWQDVVFDEATLSQLADQSVEPSSVPKDGEVVLLRPRGSRELGGRSVDVTDSVHPDNRRLAVKAAAVVGLDVAGVDLRTPDITRPLRETGGVVIEVNSWPNLCRHIWPARGRSRDAAGAVIELMYPTDAARRVPVVAVIGGADRRTVSRLLAELLGASGRCVGLALDGEVRAREELLAENLFGGAAGRALLLDPNVEAAVIAIDPTSVDASDALGFDCCDVAVVLDDAWPSEDDPVGQPATVIRAVLGLTRGQVVFGSESEIAHDVVPKRQSPRICWVSNTSQSELVDTDSQNRAIEVWWRDDGRIALSNCGVSVELVTEELGSDSNRRSEPLFAAAAAYFAGWRPANATTEPR